jgi:hypothetical protein
MTTSKKTLTTFPTDICDECKQVKPQYGFTFLTSQKKGTSEHLCSVCCNRRFAKHAGIPELEVVEFPSLTLHDSLGKPHTFYFDVRFSTGLGIQAFELINGHPGGYQFSVLEHPETPVRELYAMLTKRIEEGLSVRYIQASTFGFDHARLYINGSSVNGRIEEREDSRPVVIVDGVEYTWEEFGQCLTSYTGFNFRLECFDGCEEVETSPKPDRPEHLWWLADADGDGTGGGPKQDTHH